MTNLGIDTNNFYKFITTISLISTIYFFSFNTLILEPYNKLITESNIQKAELIAEIGYLKGVSNDLYETVKDSIKNGYIEYYYYSKKDTSEYIPYYSNYNTSGNLKLTIDRLNLLNKDYAKSVFKLAAIEESSTVNEINLNQKEYGFWIFGTLSFVIFIFSLRKWYINKSEIDK